MKISERVRFVDHKGAKILLLDFSKCNTEDVPNIVSLAKIFIAAQSQHSLLILTDVTDGRYNPTAIQAIKDLVKHNEPYVKASAVIGIDKMKKIFFDTIVKFFKRDLHLFADAESAKDWLVEQAEQTKSKV